MMATEKQPNLDAAIRYGLCALGAEEVSLRKFQNQAVEAYLEGMFVTWAA